MKLCNARIVDLFEGTASEPTHLWIADGRLSRESISGVTEQIDLGGRFVIPGLWDTHIHYATWALSSRHLDLSHISTAHEAITVIAKHLGNLTGAEPIVGTNLHDTQWTEEIELAHFDALTGERPVVMFTFDLHSAWVNSAALRFFGFNDRVGKPAENGHLLEEEMFVVQERIYDVDSLTKDESVRIRQQRDAARGLVGIVDFDRDHNHENWMRRISSGIDLLRVRTACWPGNTFDDTCEKGLRTGQILDERSLVTVGPLKIISDGSLSARTAWCRDPYAHPLVDQPYGGPNVVRAELVELLSRAKRAGLDVAIHAIGDQAANEALQAFAETHAHGSIEHAQLLNSDDIALMSALGLVASVQPGHLLYDWKVIDHQWPSRADDAFPLRSLLDANVAITFGSDAPVMPCDPWTAISAAVLRGESLEDSWHPEQRITLSEALLASTGGIKRITCGNQADLAVLDENPFEMSPTLLPTIGVYATLVGGRLTYQQA